MKFVVDDSGCDTMDQLHKPHTLVATGAIITRRLFAELRDMTPCPKCTTGGGPCYCKANPD